MHQLPATVQSDMAAAGRSEVAAQLQRNTRGLSFQTSRSRSLDGPSEMFSSLATHSEVRNPSSLSISAFSRRSAAR